MVIWGFSLWLYRQNITFLVFGKYEVGFNRLKIKLKVQTSIHEFEKLEVYSGFPLAMRTFFQSGNYQKVIEMSSNLGPC